MKIKKFFKWTVAVLLAVPLFVIYILIDVVGYPTKWFYQYFSTLAKSL